VIRAAGNRRRTRAASSSALALNPRTLYTELVSAADGACAMASSASIASGIAMNGIRVAPRTKQA
jgi:hypothetical protein